MGKNSNVWNEGPSFSWANATLAFAIIAMAIGTYMQGFYKTGDYVEALLVASVVPPIPDLTFTIVSLGLFLGIQFLKGTNRHFAKRIWWERALVFLTLPIFLLSLHPINYTCRVIEQSEEIQKNFADGVNTFKGLFKEYDQYCHERLDSYSHTLDSSLPSRSNHRGSSADHSPYAKENYLLTLRLQLLPPTEAFAQFREEAQKWIEVNGQKPSVWNPFLIGNTEAILSGVSQWVSQLEGFSSVRLTHEAQYPSFEQAVGLLEHCQASFSQVKEIVSNQSGFSKHTIWLGLLLYSLLITPYLLQQRHTKARNYYSLWKGGKNIRRSSSLVTQQDSRQDSRQDTRQDISLSDEVPLKANEREPSSFSLNNDNQQSEGQGSKSKSSTFEL